MNVHSLRGMFKSTPKVQKNTHYMNTLNKTNQLYIFLVKVIQIFGFRSRPDPDSEWDIILLRDLILC